MPPDPPRVHHNMAGQNEDSEELHEYERDGWRLGFEVQLNGVGVDAVEVLRDEDSDSSDFPDTDPDSEVECPGEGYRTLPFEVISVQEPSGNDQTESASETSQIFDDNTSKKEDSSSVAPSVNKPTQQSSASSSSKLFGSNVSPPVAKAFQKMLNEKKEVMPEKIEHAPVDFELSTEKIDEIRTAMSGFQLPPPPPCVNRNEVTHADEVVKSLIEKLRSS